VIWLDHGRIQRVGPAKEVVRAYRENEIAKRVRVESGSSGILLDAELISIKSVGFLHVDGRSGRQYAYGEDILIRVDYTAKERIHRPNFGLLVVYDGTPVFEASMLIDGHAPDFIDGDGSISCRIRKPAFLPRNYELHLFVRSQEGMVELLPTQYAAEFMVTSAGLDAISMNGPYALGHLMEHTAAVVHFDYDWDLERAVQR
jgi:ABC-2 type transport system ATP-binding protein